jgi:hypothetical protein
MFPELYRALCKDSFAAVPWKGREAESAKGQLAKYREVMAKSKRKRKERQKK